MKTLLTLIVCTASTAAMAKMVSEPVSLTADTDWRGQGVVMFTDTGSIRLNGFNLWTDGISGGTDMLADATVPDASRSFSSALYSGSVANLFDNMLYYSQTAHRICANAFPTWFAYDFGMPTRINGYVIHFNTAAYSPDSANKSWRSPKSWTLEGADDRNGSWDVLDRQESVTDWAHGQPKSFLFANDRKYRYYRLNISATNGEKVLELYQIEFLAHTPAVLVDKTVADASRVTSSSAFYSGTAANLFDNDFRYDQNAHRTALYVPMEATYDFGSPASVIRYRLYFKSNVATAERAPGTWELKGSNDKDTWTTVDSHANDVTWKNPDARTFTCANPGVYRYYQLEVTAPVAGTFMELYQVEYFTGPVVCASPSESFPVADLTVADASKSSSSSLYSGSAANLFDNVFSYSTQHRICANAFPTWFAYDFGKSTRLNGYKIYFNSAAYSSVPEKKAWRSPKSWTFEGADDRNGTWVVLDRQANVADWAPGKSRSFALVSEKAYRYYRLNISDANGEKVLELYQLEFGLAQGQCQLHVDVGTGVTQTNRTVVLDGNFDLVKEGSGTFVAELPQQSMMGCVKVEGGVLRAGASGEECALGAKGLVSVSVAPDATFDIGPFGGWMLNPIALNGGTLACAMSTEQAPTATFGSIGLTADSELSVRGPLTFGDGTGGGQIDLGGHQLAVDLVDGGSLHLALAEMLNGLMSFSVNGARAESDVKVASWDEAPSLADVSFVKARVADDGVYANYPGLLLLFR